MTNSLTNRMLAQAIIALETLSEDDTQSLPLLDCAFILDSLSNTNSLSKVRARLADRLSQQFNVQFIQNGDTYEVLAVLIALWKYDAKFVSGEQLACIVKRLIASEVAAGGPYYSDGMITIATNVQIAILMRLIAKPLPGVNAFLTEAITKQHFDDAHLNGTYLLYLLTKIDDNNELIQYIACNWRRTRKHTPWQQITALAVPESTVSMPDHKTILTTLRQGQQSSGFWEGEAILKVTPTETSSRFVTTALIVEALMSYQRAKTKITLSISQRQQYAIARAAKQVFSSCIKPLRSSAFKLIDTVCSVDKDFEITLLPRFFSQSLRTSVSLTEQQYIAFGLASLCGWIAYTVYDDILDEEGKPQNLPVANIAMRASIDYFRLALPNLRNFEHYISEVFKAMDEANAWEIDNCRLKIQHDTVIITKLPHYGNCSKLAARSFAHVLAPMAILQHIKSQQHIERSVESAFRHYLIARQLNDDLYDWFKDIQAGQATYVVTTILHDMHIKPDTYTLSTLLPLMQKYFRQTTLPKVCHRIIRHINLSKQDFIKSDLLQPTNEVYVLLNKLETSAKNSLDRQCKAKAFHATTRKPVRKTNHIDSINYDRGTAILEKSHT